MVLAAMFTCAHAEAVLAGKGRNLRDIGGIGAIARLVLLAREPLTLGDELVEAGLLLASRTRPQDNGDVHHLVGIKGSCLGRAWHRVALAAGNLLVFA